MAERVLVVDDEQVILNAVRKALRQDNLEVDTVLSAAEALSLLAGRPYALVITDLMMPGVDGLDLLRQIREMNLPSKTIMITGFPTIQSALLARRQGAFEYVTKPFTHQELRSAVVRALRTGAAEPASALAEAGGESTWHIPDHAWVRLEQDGNARVGVAGGFARAVGRIEAIRMPGAGDLVDQGRVCAVIRASDTVEHSLYCPLTGRVLEVNGEAAADPRLVESSPEQDGWLFRLTPFKAERELSDLVLG